MNQIEKLINIAYQNMTDDDNFDHDFVAGCLAEALLRIQGDWGSFDQVEEA